MLQSTYKRFSPADGLSLLNAVFGFLAMIMVVLDQLGYSFRFILLALLIDGIDGMVARKTGQSDIGETLDSMADMISLILAPAFFVYGTYRSFVSQQMISHLLLLVVFIIYVSCGLVRLASFHRLKQDHFFIGLPASTSALVVVILSLLGIDYGYVCMAGLVVSGGMISPLHFPKPSLLIDGIAGILIVISIIIETMYYAIAPLLLLVALIAYHLGGSLYLSRKTSQRKEGKKGNNGKKIR